MGLSHAHSLAEAQPAPIRKPGAFEFGVPVHVFEKADAPEGKRRRIGGICTTDRLDRQGERILQDGLDWDDFFNAGWFNDNHSAKTADVLGYGDASSLVAFKPGDILPDGTHAVANGTWVEGWLLNRPAADEIWDLAQSLQGTGRTLGFSVEGNIIKRTGASNKTIAKAKIRNVAITNAPVNCDAKLEILARSLYAAEQQAQNEDISKGLTGGNTLPVPNEPVTGNSAGAAIRKECVEKDVNDNASSRKKRNKKRVQKSMSAAQAIAHLQARIPGLSRAAARDTLNVSKALRLAGLV